MSKRLTKKTKPSEESPKISRRVRGKQPASRPGATVPAEEASAAAIASKHDALLKKIYYDVEEGFGSIADVYKAAKKKDPTVTQKS